MDAQPNPQLQVASRLSRIVSDLVPDGTLDKAAAGVVAIGLLAAAIVLLSVTPNVNVLAGITPEHLSIFGMADSTPQRTAFLVFLGTLLVGAIATPLLDRAFSSLLAPSSNWWGVALLAVGLWSIYLVIGAMGWQSFSAWTYLFLVALAVVGSRLRPALLLGLIAFVVAVAALPLFSNLMTRMHPNAVTWVDMHVTGLLGTSDLLAQGYRLFADIPFGYGILVPIGLAGATLAGNPPTFGNLIALAQISQLAMLALLLIAGWVQTRGHGYHGRVVALLALALVSSPLLSAANAAVQLPNQSGLRFLMFPVAILAAAAISRWSLPKSSTLVGAVCAIAMLHNAETGLAVTAALGLSWLVRARSTTIPQALMGSFLGVLSLLSVAVLAAVGHWIALGYWPAISGSDNFSLLSGFGAGYGGLPFEFKLLAIFMFAHAGYCVARSLFHIISKRAFSPQLACVSGLIIAWAPYYVNRTADWNLWSYIAVYCVMISPIIAANYRKHGMILVILLALVPMPLSFVVANQAGLEARSLMDVGENCVDGLSLTKDDCEFFVNRGSELREIASQGSTVWLTAYPLITLHTAQLHPRLPILDAFSAARTDKDLADIAASIRADGPDYVVVDESSGKIRPAERIPEQFLSVSRRIAAAAGYAPCPSGTYLHWSVWKREGSC